MNYSDETWKSVPGYEKLYQCSNLGRVRSLTRLVTLFDPRWRREVTKKYKGRTLQQARTRYLSVTLSKNGVEKAFEVHRLILLTFIGSCPTGMEACHRDGNRWNNRIDNLRWDTRKGNFADNVRNGTRIRGERHHSFGKYNSHAAKLTIGQVIEIKRLLREGEYRQQEIARMFSVCDTTITGIARGKTWKHIKEEVSNSV